MIEAHVAVVGAGPAGAAAAHSLATAGIEVVLIDKSEFPRDKFCGDGLTTLALRQLEAMGFDPAAVPSWTPVDAAHIRSPAGRVHVLPLPDDGLFSAVARRQELDQALVQHAVAAGAKPQLGTAVTDVAVDGDGIELSLTGITVRARHCIAADGMWSPMRKFLGLEIDGYRGEWHAFRQYFTNVAAPAADDLWVWFEPDILPGYAWSFPVGDGVANVGFGILRGGSIRTQEMKTLWPDLLARPAIREVLGPDAEPEAPHRAWPIPARIDGVPLTGPRTLFVGDAAAACDPLTGEGIGQALLTGRQAAEAIIAHGHDIDAAGRQYEQCVRADLFADHKMALGLGRLMSNRRVAEAALRAIGSTAWTRRNGGRWLFEDYPRAVVATPRRWQRGMFTGPGAYALTSDRKAGDRRRPA